MSHGGHKGFWGRHVLPVVWEVLSNQEVQKLAPLDRAASEYAISQENNQPTWWCRRCEKHSLPRDDIISHVKDEHAIENPDDNDYFPDPDQPIKTVGTVAVVSDTYKADPTTLPATIQELFKSGRAAYQSDL
ncbi:hypothetical protein QCA50_013403 [Cerrena zonata]|uniref:Uncharacterized protein n=1 Tax=Cerrena zonata TaxID=2478898 RepID=A0AAW0FQJ3_9APHY